jgi:hypothetical protein
MPDYSGSRTNDRADVKKTETPLTIAQLELYPLEILFRLVHEIYMGFMFF